MAAPARHPRWQGEASSLRALASWRRHDPDGALTGIASAFDGGPLRGRSAHDLRIGHEVPRYRLPSFSPFVAAPARHGKLVGLYPASWLGSLSRLLPRIDESSTSACSALNALGLGFHPVAVMLATLWAMFATVLSISRLPLFPEFPEPPRPHWRIAVFDAG